MSGFLSKIIGKILGDGSVPLHDVAVILPNRRAQRYLLQGLSERNGRQPMFAPQIFPMEEFVAWLSPLKVIDPVTQLLRLRTVTRGYLGSRFELHQLLSWGTAFLKDISDMDMQLQDVPAILRESAKAAHFEISFGKDELSETDREKLFFNELLADIFGHLKDLLHQNGEAYEGMIYRDCVENMASYAQKVPFKRLIFAGFYALSPAELRIIRYFQEHFQTEVYFDVDPFYCQMEEHTKNARQQREPAFFIQRDCKQLNINPKALTFYEDNFASIPKKVKIVSTSKNMRQIYCAIREVERIQKEKTAQLTGKESIVDMSDTAVVLCDENLLFPFLAAYRPDKVKINATMGFPFNATPVWSLIMQVIAVYESAFSLTADEAAELSFSGEQVQRLSNHELLRTEDPSSSFFTTVMRYSQLPQKEYFENCKKTEIGRYFPRVLRHFCQCAACLTEVKIYQQLWQEVEKKLTDTQLLFDTYFAADEVVDFPFAKYSVTKALGEISIAMPGDPDKGLQVMGLLETRMMDFKNIIMISVNEGLLPKGITYDSLLPFDFKYKFDGEEALPNYLYQDQVYAYHFFRLLQRAEDVTLIYNSASDVNLAEKSRFISQLEYEVKAQSLEETIQIEHEALDFELDLSVREPVSMPKTAEIMQKLHQYAFSASSLQSYIRCPLQFYFQHLIKIREPQALTDNLEAYELGTVIHGIYKLAFDVITKEDDTSRYSAILQHFIDHCDELVCQEMRKLQGRESLTDEALNQGAWRINRKIIDETVCQYLEMAKTELVTLPWKVIANEMPADIRDYGVTPIDGRPSFPVRLVGSLDRVQKNGAEVQILDYKTGKVEEGKLKIKVKSGTEGEEEVQRAAIKTIFTDVNHDKLFQLVMYALMYDHLTHGQTPGIQAGIISTREINKKNPAYMLPGSILNDYNILTYKTLLKEELNLLFCQIFDDRNPFTQTDDEKVCRNCDFVHLCGRQTVSS